MTTRPGTGLVSGTTSKSSPGVEQNTASALAPLNGTCVPLRKSRSRPRSSRSALRSSWLSCWLPSTSREASSSSELICDARAGGVAKRSGSRSRYRLMTGCPSPCSIRRRACFTPLLTTPRIPGRRSAESGEIQSLVHQRIGPGVLRPRHCADAPALKRPQRRESLLVERLHRRVLDLVHARELPGDEL